MELTNAQKVAILLASINEEIAASVLRQLEPDVAVRVVETIRDLGVVPGSVREQVLRDCVVGIDEMRRAVQGGEQRATSLLTKAIGEKRATVLLGDGRPSERGPFVTLADVSAEQIATALGREHPGVIGTVLRFLPAQKSAEILAMLPSEVRKQTAVFMCRSSRPPDDVIQHIEAFLASRIDSSSRKSRRPDGDNDKIKTMAGILQHVDRAVEEELMEAIDGFSGEVGSEIKDLLFTFEDVVRLGDPDVRRVLQEVDMTSLAVALRSSSIDAREKFFKNMSKRAAAGLKEEMEVTPKMKLSDVAARQKSIVNVIRQLAADGHINMGQGKGDEYV